MNKTIHFFKRNYIILLAGMFFYAGYLYFAFAGNRICNCESTTKTQAHAVGRAGASRFYHK